MVLSDPALLEEWLSLLNSGKMEILTAALFSVARIIDMEPFPEGGEGLAPVTPAADAYEGASESKASSSETSPSVLSAPSSAGLATLKKKLVTEMGKVKCGSIMVYLMKTARQPVTERKIAVYAVMTSLVQQQPGGWGLMAAYSTPGFREFVEDRNTEHSKEGKDAKFRCIASHHLPLFYLTLSHLMRSTLPPFFLLSFLCIITANLTGSQRCLRVL